MQRCFFKKLQITGFIIMSRLLMNFENKAKKCELSAKFVNVLNKGEFSAIFYII